ncbi:Ovate domain-containing protein [Cephalotus follicularis]|uniref:Transcription repressor n=1 Tax=Cephalotus follicularis TaxID=3775 RepID=A0A1Q3BXE9_CEPFO|nr:Ovate domain-containing protein [Cephalotus follicularis]
MPKKLQKSLNEYLSKMKKPHPNIHFPPHPFSCTSRKKWISNCKHSRTLSFAGDDPNQTTDQGHDKHNNKDDESATLSDIDHFLFENFRSLYISGDENNERKVCEPHSPSGGLIIESPKLDRMPPDLGGSQRFFVAPRASSSLMEEARWGSSSLKITTSDENGSSSTSTNTLNRTTTVSNEDDNGTALPNDCIAMLKYSRTPYEDFRSSMQEIVREKLIHNERVDWDFMEEFLFCYLNLNEHKSHKFILSAFVDLVVGLRQNSNKTPVRSRSLRFSRRTRILRHVK